MALTEVGAGLVVLQRPEVGAGQLGELADAPGERVGVAYQECEVFRRRRADPIGEGLELTPQHRQRRAQLVGGVDDPLAARGLGALEPRREVVEGHGELAELVAPQHRQARVVARRLESSGSGDELEDRPAKTGRQQGCRDSAQEQTEHRDDEEVHLLIDEERHREAVGGCLRPGDDERPDGFTIHHQAARPRIDRRESDQRRARDRAREQVPVAVEQGKAVREARLARLLGRRRLRPRQRFAEPRTPRRCFGGQKRPVVVLAVPSRDERFQSVERFARARLLRRRDLLAKRPANQCPAKAGEPPDGEQHGQKQPGSDGESHVRVPNRITHPRTAGSFARLRSPCP